MLVREEEKFTTRQAPKGKDDYHSELGRLLDLRWAPQQQQNQEESIRRKGEGRGEWCES